MGNGGKWKAKSKRVSTKTRCKVEKKVRDHAKKLKKEMKKNPGKFKKSKKDPGVPADCPFKDKVLQEAQEAVDRKNEEREKRRQEMKEKRKAGKAGKLAEVRPWRDLCPPRRGEATSMTPLLMWWARWWTR